MLSAISTLGLTIAAAYGIYQVTNTMHITERAYIGVSGANNKVADFMPLEGSTTIGLWVHNSGHTPAEYFWINAQGPHIPSTQPHTKFLHLQNVAGVPTIEETKNNTRFTHPTIEIPADATTEVPTRLWLTDKEIRDALGACGLNDWMAGKCTPNLRVEGSYEFLDVFGEYCCHLFCVTWNQSQFIMCPNLDVSEREACGASNYANNYCGGNAQ